ncbi:winged helix-turn-helix domain-containing protein [Streptomyces sp. NPDC086554]|uniref:winged helix-turn-helix domain-containing protein n=1 Tax=Streptomyces sp. NPDC086554 TaxID=3154864 RepID=UPI00343E19B6
MSSPPRWPVRALWSMGWTGDPTSRSGPPVATDFPGRGHALEIARAYPGLMRSPDGGGLTARQRAQREQVRFEAAELYARGIPVPEIARRLRVSRKSVYAWRARWRDGGVEDQRWTPARVATVIARRFHVRFSIAQTWRILHQMGFTVQVPVRRAAEPPNATRKRSPPGSRRRGRRWRRRYGSGTHGCASQTRPARYCGRRRPVLGPGAATRPWPQSAPPGRAASPWPD